MRRPLWAHCCRRCRETAPDALQQEVPLLSGAADALRMIAEGGMGTHPSVLELGGCAMGARQCSELCDGLRDGARGGTLASLSTLVLSGNQLAEGGQSQ
jgi:hypothetical protein